MAAVIPQVVTEDRASGAQVIDGSLKFDSNQSHHLERTPGSASNRKTFTISVWIKHGIKSSGNRHIFDTNNPYTGLYLTGSDGLIFRHSVSYTHLTLPTKA